MLTINLNMLQQVAADDMSYEVFKQNVPDAYKNEGRSVRRGLN